MKINEKTIRKSIRRFLFETSYNKYTTDDKIAGNLGDDRDDKTIPQALPIMPANQMATQLSGEEPPIEDESFLPTNNSELARAASAISKTVPDEAIDYYYNELVRVAEKARNRENKTVDLTPDGPADEIKAPLNARKKNKGWRIDYFLVSEKIIKSVKSSSILTDVMGSDHAPVCMNINI